MKNKPAVRATGPTRAVPALLLAACLLSAGLSLAAVSEDRPLLIPDHRPQPVGAPAATQAWEPGEACEAYATCMQCCADIGAARCAFGITGLFLRPARNPVADTAGLLAGSVGSARVPDRPTWSARAWELASQYAVPAALAVAILAAARR